jgi:hypothetical protein
MAAAAAGTCCSISLISVCAAAANSVSCPALEAVRSSSTTARRFFDSGAPSSCSTETFGYRLLTRFFSEA